MIIALLVAYAALGQAPQVGTSSSQPDVRCGSYCLYVALRALEVGPATLTDLEDSMGPPSPIGYSLLDLQTAAGHAGASAIAVETSLENLRSRERPFACIGIINDDHFVLIDDVTDSRVSIIDPPQAYSTSPTVFRTVWGGKALLIGKSALASEESVKRWRLASRALPGAGMGLGVATLVAILIARRRPGLAIRAGVILLVELLSPSLSGCGRVEPSPPPTRTLAASPWLFIHEERKDLGTIVRHGDKQVESFGCRLENRGPAALNIESVTASCSCTRTELSRRQIPPGESCTLTAFVRIGDNLAANSVRISLLTSDPVAPRREIAAGWQVDVPLRTDQIALDLPPLSPGESVKRTLPLRLKGMALCPNCRLEARTGSQTIFCNAEPLPNERASSHEAPIPEDQPRVVSHLHLKINPQVDENFYRGAAHIELLCGSDRRASFTLPITWSVAPIVQATPSRSYVGETKPGASISRRIVVHSRSGQPFRVTAVDSTDRISWAESAQPPAADPVQHLDLAMTAPAVDGPWRYVAHVQTDHPGDPEVLVGFSGVVNPGATAP